MSNKDDDKTDYNYYIKLLIKVIILIIFVFLIYKYRNNILLYISNLYRRFRYSSSLNFNMNPFRRARINEQRQNLLNDIEREYENMNPNMDPYFNPAAQAGAAIAADSYVRNRVRAIEAEENERRRNLEQSLRRSGRVSNWTGPIKEREYNERRLKTTTDLELEKQQAREDRAAVTQITGGYTKDYLTKWITEQGWRQPDSKYIQDYWDLVLGRTLPIMISQPPRPEFPSSSSSPLIDMDTLDNMYISVPNTQTSSLLYRPGEDQIPGTVYKPLNFGRNTNTNRNTIRNRNKIRNRN